MADSEHKKSKIAEREEEILAYWQERNIFKKSLEKDAPKGEYVFYDGPPFATGLPHYGHIFPSTMKDYVGRYQTMKGKHVARRWGWDTHGLPIENIVEKELGLKSKKDIEEFGIEKFNDIARTKIFTYADDWKKIVPRLGRFVDMENDYRTLNPEYTESVWWVFSELNKKGLVYEGLKAMHLCPHCGTTLSNFEVSQGYKDITDLSVIAKFALTNEKDIYFLAWTTTPWTLPGNVALAVNPEIVYVKIKIADAQYILAESRLAVVKDTYEIVEKIQGSKLIGLSYIPVFEYYNNDTLKNRENAFKVYGADFVTTEDGTGIVHIAPAFGADDMELGKKNNLPFIQHVGTDGTFKKEVTDFAGQKVKPIENPQEADIAIIKYLAGKRTLFAKEKFTHSYPHCYRCKTPLLNYATSSWFVEVTKFKDALVAANAQVHWVPETIGEGRFGKWLENARDWAISRSRFWGAPLPIWKCTNENCNHRECLGSIADIKEKTTNNNTFLAVRHGEAESNVKQILSSNPKTVNPLTENGREQAMLAGSNLKGSGVDIIYCSPFQRTRETAEIIAKEIGYSTDKIIYDERLHEIFVGEMDGMPDAEYQKFFSGREEKFTKTPKGGENYTMVKNRMTEFLYDINALYEGKKILIVSHNTPIWLMFAGAQGLSPKQTIATRTKQNFVENSEVKELPFAPIPHNRNYELDFHRPFIDEIVFPCTECGGNMRRIPEVFDCWFESGSMPYAEAHYPFANVKTFDPNTHKGFPADFIAEGIDQTRGWFYVMMVIGVALYGTSPYKNVIVNGMALAEDGQKLSKSLKNYPDPMAMVDAYGADAMRYYLLSSPAMKAEDFVFYEKGVDEVYKKIILRLQNTYSFFEMYGGFDIAHDAHVRSPFVLDRWILARLKEVETEVTRATDAYELDRAVWPVMDFVDDLSTWYVRRSRDRFKSDDVQDREAAMRTLRTVILEISKLLAPSMPFLAEDLYLKITGGMMKESVHLEEWTTEFSGTLSADEQEVLSAMKAVRTTVSLALEARASAKVKARQPLATLSLKDEMLKGQDAYIDLVKDEVNVKEVIFDSSISDAVLLDTTITPELKKEGQFRDIVRAVQEFRKDALLQPSERIDVYIDANDIAQQAIEAYSEEFKRITGIRTYAYESGAGELLLDEEVKFAVRLRL